MAEFTGKDPCVLTAAARHLEERNELQSKMKKLIRNRAEQRRF
jgi:hypothetical protein